MDYNQYSFDGLLPGDYYLVFSTHTGPCGAPWDIGDDESDNDMNWDLGRTAIFTLTAGQVDHSWDCGFTHCTAVGDIDLPGSYALHSNVPNPFTPQTTIAFDMPRQGAVSLSVFDVSGRLVHTLIAGDSITAGHHQTTWNGTDKSGRTVATGVYFYRLETPTYSETRRMTLLK